MDIIKNLLPDLDLTKEDCEFLSNYLEQWLIDGELNINSDSVAMLNKHSDSIDKLKSIFAKNKIMDITERKITLSKIANGEITITRYKNTRDGIQPVEEEPSFNERINAINLLTTLDDIQTLEDEEKTIILDDIKES